MKKIIFGITIMIFFLTTGAWGSLPPVGSSPEPARLVAVGTILIFIAGWGRKKFRK